MSVHPGAGGTPLTRSDIRPLSANCWSCSGLQRVWPGEETPPYSIPCPMCSGTGLEMMPFTEVFILGYQGHQQRGLTRVSKMGRNKTEHR